MLFSREIISELKFYVYRLIDPRNGETFYVGKGNGNRVFEHAFGEISVGDEDLSDKLQRIREIKLSGFEVQHVIHRHGLDENTSFEVEGALIEAYPSVTNLAGGHHNADRGVAHAQQIIERYTAPDAVLKDKIIEITVNLSAANFSLYDATRFAWRVSLPRSSEAEFAVAVVNGLIVEVFEIEKWLPATIENFPTLGYIGEDTGRFGFEGKVAPDTIRTDLLRHKVPRRPKGAANPIRYYNI